MTINEIAKLAGVSISTVSKIVNNKDANINPDTRNRVLKIVKEYNYTPYASAISAASAKTFLIGVLLKSNKDNNLMINGIMNIAQKNGYRILLCTSEGSEEEELKNIISLQNNHIDGLIWEPISEESLKHEHYLLQKEIPIQFMNCETRENASSIDFIKMGYTATQSLIQCNHTNIACMLKENSLRSRLVLEGFKKCLFENAITFTNEMLLSNNPNEYCTSILGNKFTGIISSHFALSESFCEEFDKLQYKIPYDLSIVSLRSDSREDTSFTKISSIKIPYFEFGQFLAKKIIQKCEKETELIGSFENDFVLENTLSIDIPYSSRVPQIVVVGSINIDITLNVDELPQPGRPVTTNKTSLNPGGKGSNQAIGVSKLEYPVSLIGRVGNDYEASIIYNTMSENRVDFSGITRDINSSTGKAYIQVQNDGESTITIFSGANEFLSPLDIKLNKRLFENCSYCLVQSEIPLETVITAAKTARANGAKTILKPTTLKNTSDELMDLIDIFVPNEKEASTLCPDLQTLEEKANYFLSKGVGTVIITLGHSGCYLKTQNTSRYFPAINFTPVDTTGAADAFISTLAVYLSNGIDMEKSITIASYAAGFCISRQGVESALIDRKSLEIYIKKHNSNLL